MAQERYPEDWNYQDLLWWNGEFECYHCENIYSDHEEHRHDGVSICTNCLTVLEES